MRCVRALSCRLLLVLLAVSGAAPDGQAAGPQVDGLSGSALSGLGRGPDHDPGAGRSDEDRRRIRRFDSQRRQRAVEQGTSHVDTMTGPVLPPAVPGLRDDRAAMVRAFAARPDHVPTPQGNPRSIEAILAGLPTPGRVVMHNRPIPPAALPAPVRTPAPGTLLAAGSAAYGVLLAEANSAHGGPVLAELLGGPLHGARLSGSFQRSGSDLVLRFSRLWTGSSSGSSSASGVALPAEGMPVDAWGLDPDCACYGVPGEVDHHWFSRFILPAATAFAAGWAAASAAPSTSVTVDGATIVTRRQNPGSAALHAGAADAMRAVGAELGALAPDGPVVRIPAGTEILVMFAAAVRGGDRS